mgnify:CR=1 FL=1
MQFSISSVRGNDLGAALGGLLPVHAVQGEVTADRGQKRKEILGSPGRDAFPDFGIGVVDAFLGVLPVLQDILCQCVQPFAIGCIRFPYGVLVPGKIQVEDFFVFHLRVTSFLFVLHPDNKFLPHKRHILGKNFFRNRKKPPGGAAFYTMEPLIKSARAGGAYQAEGFRSPT